MQLILCLLYEKALSHLHENKRGWYRSANIIRSKISEGRFKSLTKIRIDNDPNNGPCGAYHFIHSGLTWSYSSLNLLVPSRQ